MDLITVREFEGARDADGFRISKDRLCWYSEQLEDGNMLFFPKSPFQLADEEIELLLSQRQAGAGYHNIMVGKTHFGPVPESQTPPKGSTPTRAPATRSGAAR